MTRLALVLLVVACNREAAKPPATGSGSGSGPSAPAVKPPDLAFEIDDGDIRNYFYQRGPISAHVLATSGETPRLIVAFPAGNTGIGLWFDKGARASFVLDGNLDGIEREGGMRGVAGVFMASTDKLVVRGAVLGSIRTLRDFAALGTKPPETAHQTTAGTPLVMKRATADGKHHVELVVEPRDGTQIAVQGDTVTFTGKGTIKFHATALADDEPLTPIPINDLVTDKNANQRDLRALAFLSYKQKLLAGSWRFLTYFGRDTLMSVRLMLPVLKPDVTEAALGAVIERLAPDGDVAHEEDIGDFAALRHAKETPKPADMQAPIYDYKMVDDDFMLAPVLAAYFEQAPKERAQQFLARKTTAGQTYAAALEKNLELVITRATPFGKQPTAKNLVAIKAGIPVGEWRDSETGLGNGRVAFDVNVALVPAALDAAAKLYDTLGKPDRAKAASELAKKWQAAEKFFRVTIPVAAATASVKQYATAQGLDPAEAVASIKEPVMFHALSLDANGKPIPIMHTDDGFVLLFTNPSPEYLAQVAGRLTRPFPAGLRTPVGVVVANPAYATDPKLRDLFTRGHYHGAVIWSWQQAMLAAGLARQLERKDLDDTLKMGLKSASDKLWEGIEAMAAQSAGELWTWDVKDKKIVYAPFGQGKGHADESNAVQLWSTVYLGVKRK